MLGLKVSAVITATLALVAAAPASKDNDHSCGRSNSFWYGPKNTCLPHGGPKDKYNPPSGQNCGNKWYWHKELKCCVPPEPDCRDAECGDGWKWDDGKYSCVPYGGHGPKPGYGPESGHNSTPDKCGPLLFWWGKKSKCMHRGGPPHPSYPPKGKKCPKKWYWGDEGYCCPSEPDYGNPECENEYGWDESNLCCKPKGRH